MTDQTKKKSILWRCGNWLAHGFWAPCFTFCSPRFPNGFNAFDDIQDEKSATELLRHE